MEGRSMSKIQQASESKVPEVILTFWLIKIAATTLGETGGDALSMSMNLGYAISTGIFFAIFLITLIAQTKSNSLRPFLYWSVIVATTTCGTTMADFADRSLGIGYVGGSLILFAILVSVLASWRLSVGAISFSNITSPKVEFFYWMTILASNTLGTALGDFLADSSGLGYEGGAVVFLGALILVAITHYYTKASRAMLFWTAFVLTRPLGATVGDLLTKPLANGGFNLSRFSSTAVLAIFMIAAILLTPQRAGGHPGQERSWEAE